MRFSCFSVMSGVYSWVFTAFEIASTGRTDVLFSRNSAALRVGVVTASAREYDLAAASHASPIAQRCMNFGMSVYSSRFSGMKWLVPTMRMPRSFAPIENPRPVMMCDWKCTTSGFTWSRIFAAFCLMRHGSANRSHGCGYQRQLKMRHTGNVAPSCVSICLPVSLFEVDGAATCTSCPRSSSPFTRLTVKVTAPLMSGANVSATTSTRRRGLSACGERRGAGVTVSLG